MLVFTPSQSLFKAGVPSGEINFVYNIARKFQLASVLHIPMVHAHDVSKQIPREKKFPSVTPRATLTHLSCSPNFPRTSYLDERTLTYEPIVKYTSAMCEETLLAQSRQNRLKSVSTRAPGSRASCHLTDFNETLPV